jgi:YidC/Oxa1 family membrane protein insertase
MSVIRHLSLFWQEIRAVNKLTSQHRHDIVFYSEKSVYHVYFADILNALLQLSDLPITYVTSDPADPVLECKEPRIQPLYVNSLLSVALAQLNAHVLAMTMPDLHQHHIKRSSRGVNHVYVFHAMVSSHMIYRKGAFAHFDTVLCVGPHHLQELAKAEEVYRLPRKHLIPVGYPLIDTIYRQHQAVGRKQHGPPLVLVAPSWHPHNLLDTCLDPLLDALTTASYQVVVRPHPEFLKRRREAMSQILQKWSDRGVRFDMSSSPTQSLYDAEVVITDWSGIAFEYAFGTERPVLFIDTPRKVLNPEYELLDLVPVEVSLRERIGAVISPHSVQNVAGCIEHLLDQRSVYREEIKRARAGCLYNWTQSAEAGAKAILDLVTNSKNSALLH